MDELAVSDFVQYYNSPVNIVVGGEQVQQYWFYLDKEGQISQSSWDAPHYFK